MVVAEPSLILHPTLAIESMGNFHHHLMRNSMLSPTVIGVGLHRLGLKSIFGQVEVQRGEVNIAVESTMVHRVQLQCNVDELEGKYTEAKPRCTCPSYESNLHQVVKSNTN